jgi:cytidylate kinase
MKYIYSLWKHQTSDPTYFWYEIDTERWTVRTVEFFPDGSAGLSYRGQAEDHTDDIEVGGTGVPEAPIPELNEINSDAQFEASYVSRELFEQRWREALRLNGKSLPLTIAIDGPAASGKGTLARRLADYYHLPHLDTGLTYRAVGRALLTHGLPLDNVSAAETAARQVDLKNLDREALSAHEVGEAASKVAVFPTVRKILVDKQRAFAAQPGGAVLDGRDIGTVVCPDADVKLFVTASAEVRAGRRLRDILSRGGHADLNEILADIVRRDERDMGRADSPLRPAADAHLLDTSEMSIEAAFQAARTLIDNVLAKRNEA